MFSTTNSAAAAPLSSASSSPTAPSADTPTRNFDNLVGSEKRKAKAKQLRKLELRPDDDRYAELCALHADPALTDEELSDRIVDARPYRYTAAVAEAEVFLPESTGKVTGATVTTAVFNSTQPEIITQLLPDIVSVTLERSVIVLGLASVEAQRLIDGQLLNLGTLGQHKVHRATSRKSSRAMYIDVHGIESVADYLPLHHALRRYGKVPSVYVGHRFTIESTNCLEQVARFLLDGTTLPAALQLPNGQHVEQILFQGRYLTVYTKNRTNSFPSRREGRSPLCLDLDSLASAAMAQKRPAPAADAATAQAPVTQAPRGKKAKSGKTPAMSATPLESPTTADPSVPTPTPAHVSRAPQPPPVVETWHHVTRRLGRSDGTSGNDVDMEDEGDSDLDHYWQPGTVIMPAPTMNYPPQAKCQTILPQVVIQTKSLRASIPRRTWRQNQVAIAAEDMTLAELEQVIAEATAEGAAEATAMAARTDSMPEATEPLPWVQLLASLDADKLLSDVLHRPLAAQLALMDMSMDMTQLPLLLRLHTVHRWTSATKPLAPVITFGARYHDIVGTTPAWDDVQDFMTSFKPPTVPMLTTSGLSPLDVELSLSLFELALATQAPFHYKHDAMIVAAVGHAVDWLPAYNSSRMLTSRCLFELLRAPLGHAIVTHLCTVASNPYTIKLLALQQCEQLYSTDHSVVLRTSAGVKSAVLAPPRRC